MNIRLSSAAVICGLLLSACSIKEDRTDCPSVLVLDLSEVEFDSLKVSVEAVGGYLYKDVVYRSDYGEPYCINVPRGNLLFGAYSGDVDAINYSLPGLVIPLGNECFSVHMDNSSLEVDGEVFYKKVELHKNYTCVSFNLLHEGVPSAFNIRLLGSINGYSADGNPQMGIFSVDTSLDERGRAAVRVPRQIDGSLELVIMNDDKMLRKFAIGEYILQSGFNWEALNLDDIEVDIDYSLTMITLKIAQWQRSFELEVVI